MTSLQLRKLLMASGLLLSGTICACGCQQEAGAPYLTDTEPPHARPVSGERTIMLPSEALLPGEFTLVPIEELKCGQLVSPGVVLARGELRLNTERFKLMFSGPANLTDAHLSALGSIDGLGGLILAGSDHLSSDRLRELIEKSPLAYLDLIDTAIDYRQLQGALLNCDIRRLSICVAKESDGSVGIVLPPSLRSLRLFADLSVDMFKAVANCQRLIELDLSGCSGAIRLDMILERRIALQVLNVSGTSFGDRECGQLQKLPTLTTLIALNNAWVTEQGIAGLSKCELLHRLELGGAQLCDENGLEPISKLGKLESLCLSNMSVSDNQISHISGLRLQRLFLNRLTYLTRAGLERLLVANEVKRCTVWGMRQITDDDMVRITGRFHGTEFDTDR